MGDSQTKSVLTRTWEEFEQATRSHATMSDEGILKLKGIYFGGASVVLRFLLSETNTIDSVVELDLMTAECKEMARYAESRARGEGAQDG